MTRRPNILLITCDQWRGDSLGAAGHPVVKTPNADALAADGVMFERHYAGAAPCSPARACLYTGLYQMNNRVCRNGSPLDARHGNIALSARALGYTPTLFGYTDTSPDPRWKQQGDPALNTYEGFLPGFVARQPLPEHQKQWLSWLKTQGLETDAQFPDIHRPANGDIENVTTAPPIYSKDQTPAAFLTGEFVRWLGEQDAPWFAHISYLSPHPPFIVPEPFNTMYDPASGPDFARHADWRTEAAQHPYIEREMKRQTVDDFLPGYTRPANGDADKNRVRSMTDAEFRTVRAIYWGMISEVDSQLGRVWAAIKAAGAWDDTVIILTSDHAERMGDHFLLSKGGWFEGSFHLPLIVRAPRQMKTPGAKVDAFSEAVDIMPTLLDLMGAEAQPWLDGASLAPLLRDERPADWRNAAHWELDFRAIDRGPDNQAFGLKPQQCNLSVIRDRKWKYVHFAGPLPPLLYDMENDPGELTNLAEDPAYLRVRLDMAEKLLAWRAEHLDQSLSLSELTEQGMVGQFAPLAWKM